MDRGRHYYHLSGRLSAAKRWSLPLKNELLGALAPRLILRPSLLQRFYPEQPIDREAVAHFAEAEIVTACRDHGALLLDNVRNSPIRDAILLSIADDLTSLLKQAMEMFEIVQRASDLDDPSYLDQPSISPHDQNAGHHDWTALIELLRDSWKAMLKDNRDTARRIVERWRTIHYPVFRRMSFFAMAESDLYSPSEVLEYLSEKESWWLWSPRTAQESYRVLESICHRLSEEEIIRLTSKVLGGLPRSMVNGDMAEEHYRQISDRSVWLRLAKLKHWGCHLSDAAAEALTELSNAHPTWRLSEDDRDEFPMWMEGSDGEVPIQNEDEFLTAKDDEVIAQLIAFEAGNEVVRRKWCRVVAKQPTRGTQLIAAIAEAQKWPSDLWEPILHALKNAELDLAAWSRFMGAVLRAPEDLYKNLARYFAWLLRDLTSCLPTELDGLFWKAWDRAQKSSFEEDDDEPGLAEDPIARAINLPCGLLTEALLDRLAKATPNTSTEVSNEAWARLTEIADGPTRNHTYARVILAARLAWLYQLGAGWCESHLRKYFDWAHSPEAMAVWQGFVWQASLTPELWRTIKPDFMIALSRKTQLGKFKSQVAILFGFVCVDRPDWLLPEEMQNALRTTDAEGRADVARVVFRRLQGAGAKGEDMWLSRIGPWFDRNWPKDRRLIEPASAFNLAMAATYAGDAFPAAVNSVSPFLTQYAYYSPLIDRLMKTDYPERFAEPSLRLLDVVNTTDVWVGGNVRDLLSRLRAALPEIGNNQRFGRLDDYLRARDL